MKQQENHLHMISKGPAAACTVPVAPDFITTFQCIGEFLIGLIQAFTTSGAIASITSAVVVLFCTLTNKGSAENCAGGGAGL